ncbi:PKD domain-containing protein, partial [Lentimicrobium sp. L6]
MGKFYIRLLYTLLAISIFSISYAQGTSNEQKFIDREKIASNSIPKDENSKFGLNVTPNKTAIQIVEELLGEGFFYGTNVFNANLIGPSNANGFFVGYASNIGMPSGIVLTSGDAKDAEGFNSSQGITVINGTSGDTDLTAIAGVQTKDASGIEFDFIPETDTIKFQYVFGSDEYPEYNNGPFNDVFAFFLSGDDPTGGVYVKKNIALIPNTDDAISIMNVNSEDNNQYYVNNNFQQQGTVEYDGFTVELTAWAAVVPCTEYHIKIVIADAQDGQFDSGVFLRSNSFTAAQVEIIPEYAHASISNSVEGCNDVTLKFGIDARTEATTVDFTVLQGSGQAQYGIDYTTVPPLPNFPIGSFTYAAGETSKTLKVLPIDDGIAEAPELFQVEYTHYLGCEGSSTDTVTVQIEDHEPVAIQALGDLEIACGESTELSVVVSDGYPDYTYSWSESGFGNVSSIDVSPTANTSYTISVNDECGYNNEYTFDVEVIQPEAFITGEQEICSLETIELQASEGTAYLWGDNSTAQTLEVTPSVTTTYTCLVTSSDGCQALAEVTVPVLPLPSITLTDFPNACVTLSSILLNHGIPSGGVYSGPGVTESGGNYYFNPSLFAVNSIHEISYTVSGDNGCIDTETSDITVTGLPIVTFSTNNNVFCVNEGHKMLYGGSPSGGYYSGPGVISNGTMFDPNSPETGPGTYYLEYHYTDGAGCENSSIEDFTVAAMPEVTFGEIPLVCAGLGSITLTQGSPAGGEYSGPGVNAAGVFDPAAVGGDGTYELQYFYTTPEGCDGSADQQISVQTTPSPPTSISSDYLSFCTAEIPNKITLSCEGSDLSYTWYANDLNGTSIALGKSILIDPPLVTTEYFVRSESPGCGESNALSITVEVFESPTAEFSLYNICDGEQVDFTDQSINGSISQWEWSFGDGGTSNEVNPSHTYTSYGTKNVILTVTTDDNCSSIQNHELNVYDNPVADFSADDNCLGLETVFTNNSNAPISDITSYNWTIDGNVFNTEDLSYTFPNAGTYTVNLELITEFGCDDNQDLEITISPSPESSFTYINPCLSNVVELTNTSTASSVDDPIVSYLWEFDNGDNSDEEELTYIYPSNGFYQINLTVTNGQGCSHTFFHDNVIVNPDFDVDITNDEFCIGEEGNFNGVAIPSNLPLEYDWILPGGTFADGQVA